MNCCGNDVVDNELEEGEIVDVEDDQLDQVPVDRIDEPRQYKENRSWICNERSPEKESGRESNIDSYHVLKRNVSFVEDDDEWSEDCVALHKRRRISTSDEKHAAIGNVNFYQKNNDNDGYNGRETIYDDYVKSVSFTREFANEEGDFQHLRVDCYDRKSSDEAGNYHRINNGRAIPKTTHCPEVKPAKRMQKIMKLCRYYRSNRYCYKQDRCAYMHGGIPCKFYHTGQRCYSGDTCRYSHAEIDYNQKKLLPRNAYEDHNRMFVGFNSNGVINKIPSLLSMRIPVPEGLNETFIKNATAPLTSQQEPTVEDISVPTDEVTAAQLLYSQPSDDYEVSSDDGDEMDNLVIDEGE